MIKIVKGSITNIQVDAIVNAANEGLWQGGGVCGYIFQAAGSKELSEACSKIGHCDTGNAVITLGFHSMAKYIIHAVGPIYKDGFHHESELLYGAYYNALNRAKENHCTSIAFPLISAGIYGYPLDKAWDVALQSVMDWLHTNGDLDVYFMVLDPYIQKIGEIKLNNV